MTVKYKSVPKALIVFVVILFLLPVARSLDPDTCLYFIAILLAVGCIVWMGFTKLGRKVFLEIVKSGPPDISWKEIDKKINNTQITHNNENQERKST